MDKQEENGSDKKLKTWAEQPLVWGMILALLGSLSLFGSVTWKLGTEFSNLSNSITLTRTENAHTQEKVNTLEITVEELGQEMRSGFKELREEIRRSDDRDRSQEKK